MLPSEDDVRLYRESGYYISRKIFTDEDIESAISGSESLYSGAFEKPVKGPFADFELNWNFGSGLRKTDYASFFNEALAVLVRKPILGAIAARLSGSDEIRLWHDQLLYKPSEKESPPANVGWHTDRMYWQMCTSDRMLTAWIPFHDCDEEIGTITMIEGSHQWPDNTSDLDFFSSDMENLEKRFRTGGSQINKVPMLLKKGQVSFHNCLTIHGSGPNRTDRPRRSIAVHLQDSTNQYREFRYVDGTLASHTNDQLTAFETGKPDYSNEAVCPVLYRR